MTSTHAEVIDQSGEPVLVLERITKFYGAVRALSDVSLEVHHGEVLALVGDNGAGKSTLVKIISGVETPSSGRIVFEGHAVTINRPQDATSLGIATVYQDLALCDNLDVVNNLFLGRESTANGAGGAVGWMDETDMEKRALQLLGTLSVHLPSVRAHVAALSGGQRQSVAIARSLLGEPKIVLLDEPTAALGVAQTAQVLELILRLKERGHAVVIISHNLADVFAVCDRIAVLRLGRYHGDFRVTDTSPDEIVGAITGARPSVEQVAGRRAGLPSVSAGPAGLSKGSAPGTAEGDAS
jgi:D-xylose transport system ATP-binding protein